MKKTTRRLVRGYRRKIGPGSNAGAGLTNEGNVLVSLSRKIIPGDVQDGVLIPTALTTASAKGGKVMTMLIISPKAARALHGVLGSILKDMPPVEHDVGGEVLQTVE